MKEQLISFDTAKLAKEKGFDVPCYWYCSYKRKVPTHEQNFYPDIGTGKLENFNEDKGGFYERFSLPTQSLLQKWLREVHNIFIQVSENSNVKIYLKDEYYDEFFTFNSYEEALEKGLQEGLKLIP